ncbi:MAG: hypothetical protein U9N14_00405, partial [Pseudomonadota bacterium]|nr:hypothetical protein [Pseudomonadota bacterium]
MTQPVGKKTVFFEIEIDVLGTSGDGIGRRADGTTIIAPLTIPGDRIAVRATKRKDRVLIAQKFDLIRLAPDRQTPPCPLFGSCGGCALQNLTPDAYTQWMRATVTERLKRRNIPVPTIRDPEPAKPGTRRRNSPAAAC